MRYFNRQDAGIQLAHKLGRYKGKAAVVLALPRGGVILGKEVANALGVDLGLVLVRKIGHPYYSEYAIGALAEDETPIYNEYELVVTDAAWRKRAEVSARKLLEKRRRLYYGEGFVAPDLKNQTVILVDDGIATGLTMQAAVQSVKHKGAKGVVVAAPVASAESITMLKGVADEVIVLDDPNNFMGSVGAHYIEFAQVNDEEVKSLLREVRDGVHEATSTSSPTT